MKDLTPAQKRIKKISARAKEIYYSKGNKLTWVQSIKKASKEV